MDKKREKIIVVADSLFALYGIKKTTMEDIAHKSGIGKSTLYYYFPSKEEIFAEVIQRDSEKFQKILEEAVHKSGSPIDKLKNYIVARTEHLKRLDSYYITLSDEYPENFEFIERSRENFTMFELETITRILEKGLAENIFTFTDVSGTAESILIILKGVEYLLTSQKSLFNLDCVLENILTLILNGLVTKK